MEFRKNNNNGSGKKGNPELVEFFRNGGKDITIRDLKDNLSEDDARELLSKDTTVSGRERKRMIKHVRKHGIA